ncbi:hypothetical protein SAMN05216559_2547 [Halomicrobium zhouii]|uniref:Uncharacterized protein n=1 Tax=Halomicrobium zhouii TaxID=767519 RepID=A0A1I6LEU6_9EURY|nr:hypothetical protein [Halomicrobium zhouii]SFS01788.1 hypothetical protein SAMN05216559_2547 [Halomicrobium zhouii]
MYPPIAQFGIPGAQELLIILMIFGMLAIPVVGIALVIKYLTGNDSETDERIAELEREVEELRAADSKSDRASGDDR